MPGFLPIDTACGYLVALFTADADRAGIAADLAVLYQHLDLLLPEGT